MTEQSTGSGRFADYGRPRKVDGGLRARTARGSIGASWWSRRFVDVLESFALGTRLTRGRAYARAGQVLSLEVAPGLVTAVVQGSRPKPYQVTVRLHPYPEPVWTGIETVLAGQALFSAQLLAGDLPPELERVFAEADAPLFPSVIDDLTMRCNCPDFAVPCKHLAASFYLLAEAFDADPFQLLHWRGRTRAELLDRLRELRTGHPSVEPVGPSDEYADPVPAEPLPGLERPAVPVAGAGLALADLPDLAPATAVDRYWQPPVPLPDPVPILATEPDLLLRQLGAPGAPIGGPGLVERLRRAYDRFGQPAP
ncbi:SWIM zinc finger family protein [Micromonospora sp. NBC_01796]|uniref:SWIM zinc finger family protein n=1 Tax=Micromonospora sp. NBC_01796 TaxID=2975987 RepID=UPI002DDB7D85|nr:SWIM zinc finger family protein [Micromonospora sp. NBC_01796]WSA83219.1 SWIM zinc finger family protein [Micromonospora sp. NBC_01796]